MHDKKVCHSLPCFDLCGVFVDHAL
jgi:hypothetical protein